MANRNGVARQGFTDIEFLGAIADESRQRIISILATQGETASGKIASQMPPMTHATVSHHLGILKRAGILALRKKGKQAIYQLDREAFMAAVYKLNGDVFRLVKAMG